MQFFGSNVETYARIKPVKPVKPVEPVKPKDPENKPVVVEPAEPAKEDPKKEDAPKEIKGTKHLVSKRLPNVLALGGSSSWNYWYFDCCSFRKKLLSSKVKF